MKCCLGIDACKIQRYLRVASVQILQAFEELWIGFLKCLTADKVKLISALSYFKFQRKGFLHFFLPGFCSET